MRKLRDYLNGKLEFSKKVEDEILELLEDLDYIKELKSEVVNKLSEDGFVKSEHLSLSRSTVKTIKIEKALELPKEEFDNLFDITKVKLRKGRTLGPDWYKISPRVSLKRKK